ncbi:MAG: FAD:protein FMN transferase [Gaiellales bacterium]
MEPAIDWTFRAMGADWRIHHAGGVSGADAQAVAAAVLADERRWSRFLPQSDVSRITREAGRPVGVTRETIDLVEAARAWSARTDGVFQPLVGSHLAAWGYRAGVGDGAPAAAPDTTAAVDAAAILLSRREGTIAIPAGTALDLGGIGKSWAAVRAGRLLADRCDDQRLIIDAGGDLAIVRGTHRVETAAGAVVAAEGTGVATSSSERRAWSLGDGTVAHHLIDAATGTPCGRGTAVVAGIDPVAADVLASCLVIDPLLLGRIGAPAALVDATGLVTPGSSWSDVAGGVRG